MKKLLLILIIFCVCFSINTFAKSLSEAWDDGKDKVGEIFDDDNTISRNRKCPIYRDTPLSEVERPMFEMGLRSNFGDFPSGGSPQIRFENVDISFIGNLGPTFHWYTWLGFRTTEKKNYIYENESDEYDKVWQSKMLFAGFGLYLHPIFRVFGGFGKIALSNTKRDAPDLELATEMGGAISYVWYGNRIELMYKFIDASIAGSDIQVEDSTAEGSYNSFSISLYFPIDF